MNTAHEALRVLQDLDPRVKEALARCLGNYLYLRAFGSNPRAELDHTDITNILDRMKDDMLVIQPSERGRSISVQAKPNGRSTEQIRDEVSETIDQLTAEQGLRRVPRDPYAPKTEG